MVGIVNVSPNTRQNFSLERVKVVYFPSSRRTYGSMYIPTNGMFGIEGEPEKVRGFDLEPLVKGFDEAPPNLDEAMRTGSNQKIQAAHERFVRCYDGSVSLGVYFVEGGDASLKVVAEVNKAFSDTNGELTLEKLTCRLAALWGFMTKRVQLPAPNAPSAPGVLYVAISKDYNAVQQYWDKVLSGKTPLAQPI